MLSIPVQKDIGEYQEKVVAGLSAQALAFLAAGSAVGLAVGALGIAVLGLPRDAVYLVSAACVMAGFAGGFIKPFGLPMAAALPLILRTYTGKNELIYSTSASLALRLRAEKETHADEEKKKKGCKEDVLAKEKYDDDRARTGDRSAEWALPRVHGALVRRADG